MAPSTPLMLATAAAFLFFCDLSPAAPSEATASCSAKLENPEAKPEDKSGDASKNEAPKPAPVEPEFPEPIDLGGFGSDEPVERADMPTRGVITLSPEQVSKSTGAHWETYVWPSIKMKRWGRYQVRLTYSLTRASLGMQFRIGATVVKKSLPGSQKASKSYLTEIYVEKAGELPVSMLTPPTDESGFVIHELALIPAPEGVKICQAKDGVVTLEAKDATTWSENMRYEPKPEKNCLGFWTDPDDFAEWEFELKNPGKYKISVIHGCGGGNHGSEVAVENDSSTLKFTTQDTGGFQNWQPIEVGVMEFDKAGRHRLVVDPVNKTKKAILDVQKVILTPVR